MVDMEAENAWNKLIAFKNGKDSVYKVRRPKPVFVQLSGADRDMHCLG